MAMMIENVTLMIMRMNGDADSDNDADDSSHDEW